MNIATNSRLQSWSALESLGFVRRNGGLTFQFDGVLVKPTRQWCVLQTDASPGSGPEHDSLGKPGLWRPGTENDAVREFHLPLAILGPGRLDEDGIDSLRACVDWALSTGRGVLPAEWTCPPRELIESSIPDGGLTIQSGPIVRQGELVTAGDRLAIRVPIVPVVAAGLPEPRREWLHRLIGAAHRHWRMVRIGWGGTSERPSIEAEINLSGAPHEVLDRLTPIAVDALRWVVEWLLLPANIVADVRVESGLFDVFLERDIPRKGDWT
jgi:hypothetical protein